MGTTLDRLVCLSHRESACPSYILTKEVHGQSVGSGVSGSGLRLTVCNSVGQQPHVAEEAHTDNANGAMCLLILDSHRYHVSSQFLLCSVKDNIVAFFLYTHSSHLLQPVDLSLFATWQ